MRNEPNLPDAASAKGPSRDLKLSSLPKIDRSMTRGARAKVVKFFGGIDEATVSSEDSLSDPQNGKYHKKKKVTFSREETKQTERV